MTATSDHLAAIVGDLKELVERNTADLKVQFERIAQLQAEVDVLRAASNGSNSHRKKFSGSLPAHVAADRRSSPRR
jgi:hypothetical protein